MMSIIISIRILSHKVCLSSRRFLIIQQLTTVQRLTVLVEILLDGPYQHGR